MMEEKDLIRIRWHVDRTQEPAVYMLVCDHPDYAVSGSTQNC